MMVMMVMRVMMVMLVMMMMLVMLMVIMMLRVIMMRMMMVIIMLSLPPSTFGLCKPELVQLRHVSENHVRVHHNAIGESGLELFDNCVSCFHALLHIIPKVLIDKTPAGQDLLPIMCA